MAPHPRRTDSLALLGFLALCLGVSGLGGAVTATSVNTWYQTLEKPGFNPPDWVFTPVWIALFVAMAFAAWRIWRRDGFAAARLPLAVFALQLALNLLWSVLFFGLRAPTAALAEIFLLAVAIAATLVLFWRRDRIAGLLFLPYLAWVLFALVLNAAIVRLN
jgi:tryptophan-rich sensory protein